MWGWVIVGGAVLFLLLVYSLLDAAARADAAMAGIIAALENHETTHET